MVRLNSRRLFLKRGLLFVPATFGILRARADIIAAGPIMRTIAAAGGGASTVISFDGADDVITLGSAVDLSGDNTYSVSVWVRTGSLAGAWEPILWDVDDTGLVLRSSGIFQFYPAGTGHSTVTATSTDTWYHYCFTNNAGTWNAYLNGTSNANGTGAAVGPNAMTKIGLNGGDHFNGRISDLAVYSVALTGTQVANLAAKTTTPDAIGSLVAYLKLDEVANGASGDGVTFADSSGNGHSGTGSDGANNTGLTGVTKDY